MNREKGLPENLRVLLTAEKVQQRVQELGKQITKDCGGDRLVVVIAEDGFVFAADLIRSIDSPVVCQFVLSDVRDIAVEGGGQSNTREIFYYPEADVKGESVLLVVGLVQSGVTSEFLVRNLYGRGAAKVKIAALLDRQSGRRIAVQPDYFGFSIDDEYVAGYGLGAPMLGRNLPYVAAFSPISGGEAEV